MLVDGIIVSQNSGTFLPFHAAWIARDTDRYYQTQNTW
jgi:hypothetical protein